MSQLADMILDSQPFDNDTQGNANSYEISYIRQWLNSTFIDAAFTELQREIILDVVVDNSAATTNDPNNPYACANTEDKVYLASYADITNADYGFVKNTDRQKMPTDYARCQGTFKSDNIAYLRFSLWWLRSPETTDITKARCVGGDGSPAAAPWAVTASTRGIVPMIQIKL